MCGVMMHMMLHVVCHLVCSVMMYVAVWYGLSLSLTCSAIVRRQMTLYPIKNLLTVSEIDNVHERGGKG